MFKINIRPKIKVPLPQKKGTRITFAVLVPIIVFTTGYIIRDVVTKNRLAQAKEMDREEIARVVPEDVRKSERPFPVRLKIPRINVDAAIEYIGVTDNGEMGVPVNITDVGWYKFGPSPGEAGNAVVSGHFDGRGRKKGVFNKLNSLKSGDKINVVNNLGSTTGFVVRSKKMYDPGAADEVFVAADAAAHLNLVTCDGVWNAAKKSYSKRLVLFADRES